MSEKKGKKPDNSTLSPGSVNDFWASVLGDALGEASSRLRNPLPGKEPAKPAPGKAGDSTVPEPPGPRPADSATGPEGGFPLPEASATVPEGGFPRPAASATIPESGLPHPEASATVPEDGLTLPEASATVPEGGLTLPEASATVLEGGLPLPGASTTVPEPPEKAVPVLFPAPVTDSIRPGETLLGTYRVESAPIQGGMGRVWRVYHTGWDVVLAMKKPRPEAFQTETQKAAFTDECRHWMNLGLHPNIVTCYYVREIEGVPTIFSEWMDNGSLESHIKNGTLYEGTAAEVQERLLDIAIQFARGLHYAHENHLVHQDVKPDNLLLGHDREAKVSDFGLAKARNMLAASEAAGTGPEADPGATVVVHGSGMTPAYCSPEQAEGRPLTRRTDLYSWAVSVLEMYLGDKPWAHGKELTGPMVGSVCRDYFALCVERPVPEAMQELLARCLRQDPEERPETFASVEASLLEIYRELTGQDYPRPEPKAASDTAASLNNRALSYLDIGQPKEAERLWEEALQKEPSNIDARFNRELYLVRSRRKNDNKAVEELNRFIEIREAGLPEVLARDGGGSQNSVLRSDLIRWIDNSYGQICNTYVRKTEILNFRRIGSIYRSVSSIPEIVHLDLKSGRELAVDPMDAVREAFKSQMSLLSQKGMDFQQAYVDSSLLIPGTSLMLTACIFEGRVYKAESSGSADQRLSPGFHSISYLCLYDIDQKQLTKQPVLFKDIKEQEYHIRSFMIRKDGKQAVCLFHGPLGAEKESFGSATVDLPSLHASGIMPLDFKCFLPEGRCLLYGKNAKKKRTLQILEADGRLREVFTFRRVPGKVAAVGDGSAFPFLCYCHKNNSEIFRLDESFKRIRMDFPPLEKGTTFRPLWYDDNEKLLYLNGYDNLLEIWHIEKQVRFTMPLSPEIGMNFRCVSFDAQNRVMLLMDRDRWASVYLPLYHPVKAPWRLSRIITARTRIAEEEQLSRLIHDFDQSIQAGDYPKALSIHHTCCGIPGFSGSPEAWNMGNALEPFCKKKKLLVLRSSEDLPGFPEFALNCIAFTNTITRQMKAASDCALCSDGIVALYDAHTPADGIRFFTREGISLRTVRLPETVRYAAIRNDRIYAVTRLLCCMVYDLHGERMQVLTKGLEDPKQEVKILDLDPDGRQVLFEYRYLSAPNGIWQLNLSTGETLQLQLAKDRSYYKRFTYLKNQTIVTNCVGRYMSNKYRLPMTFQIIDRYSSRTGERLPPVSINKASVFYPNFTITAFPEEDRICVRLWDFGGGLPEEMHIYNSDGDLLSHWEWSGSTCCAMFFPDSPFMAYARSKNGHYELCIRDVYRQEDIYVKEIPIPWQIAFRPDGREIYVQSLSDKDPVKVYRLEYEYRLPPRQENSKENHSPGT